MEPRNRRTFVKNAAAGSAGALLVRPPCRGRAASQDRAAGANRRVRVALIGCGGQGGRPP